MSSLNDDQLRAMVRESIARAMGQAPAGTPPVVTAGHTSHFRYALLESDGPCVIEPSVPCNHCGYCQSHGH